MWGSGEHVRRRTRTLTSPHPARDSAGDRSSRGTRSHAALSNVSLRVTARAYATVCKGISVNATSAANEQIYALFNALIPFMLLNLTEKDDAFIKKYYINIIIFNGSCIFN